MRYVLTLALGVTTACGVFAQEAGKTAVVYQDTASATAGPVLTATLSSNKIFSTPVQGAPYSATITNETSQTLADGNRIVQSSSGATARDSQGRTRQDTALPAIGNLSAANPPHIVFIMDPVAQVSYTLNLTSKTAQKISMPSPASGGPNPAGEGKIFFTQFATQPAGSAPPPAVIGMAKVDRVEEQSAPNTEDLGTQTMEGLLVTGMRTTHTIPAGEIGNEKPITSVTEVWTSPDLKTVVYSKRTDPRMGEQTFKLTNIVRGEPDPSLFTVPADFKVTDGPQNVIYRTNR